jgi:hypothetical protein
MTAYKKIIFSMIVVNCNKTFYWKLGRQLKILYSKVFRGDCQYTERILRKLTDGIH